MGGEGWGERAMSSASQSSWISQNIPKAKLTASASSEAMSARRIGASIA
jgi:hypothetical protein